MGLFLLGDMFLDGLNFSVEIKFINQFAEILDIIFVVHFRKFFEDDKLIYRTMHLFASFNFKLFE